MAVKKEKNRRLYQTAQAQEARDNSPLFYLIALVLIVGFAAMFVDFSSLPDSLVRTGFVTSGHPGSGVLPSTAKESLTGSLSAVTPANLFTMNKYAFASGHKGASPAITVKAFDLSKLKLDKITVGSVKDVSGTLEFNGAGEVTTFKSGDKITAGMLTSSNVAALYVLPLKVEGATFIATLEAPFSGTLTMIDATSSGAVFGENGLVSGTITGTLTDATSITSTGSKDVTKTFHISIPIKNKLLDNSLQVKEDTIDVICALTKGDAISFDNKLLNVEIKCADGYTFTINTAISNNSFKIDALGANVVTTAPEKLTFTSGSISNGIVTTAVVTFDLTAKFTTPNLGTVSAGPVKVVVAASAPLCTVTIGVLVGSCSNFKLSGGVLSGLPSLKLSQIATGTLTGGKITSSPLDVTFTGSLSTGGKGLTSTQVTGTVDKNTITRGYLDIAGLTDLNLKTTVQGTLGDDGKIVSNNPTLITAELAKEPIIITKGTLTAVTDAQVTGTATSTTLAGKIIADAVDGILPNMQIAGQKFKAGSVEGTFSAKVLGVKDKEITLTDIKLVVPVPAATEKVLPFSIAADNKLTITKQPADAMSLMLGAGKPVRYAPSVLPGYVLWLDGNNLYIISRDTVNLAKAVGALMDPSSGIPAESTTPSASGDSGGLQEIINLFKT